MYYYEKLATKLFEMNPELNFTGKADEVLDAAWPLVVEDCGKKAARYMFNYDEDFPSDLVSAYAYMVKNTLTV
jgi:hypothetical protein